ncbi:MAG: OmpA family protein, partial [Pseudomonadales bacterium]
HASVGFMDYEDDRVKDPALGVEFDDDLFGSIGLGYRFDNPWGIELVYNYGEADTDPKSTTDITYQGIHLDGLYHFDNDSNVTPYLAFGGGYVENELDDGTASTTPDETNLNAGGGVKIALNDLLSLRGDLRAFREFDEHHVDLAASIGLQFLFGGKNAGRAAIASAGVAAAAAQPAVADGDKDGVPDDRDNCPITPKGIQVGANGCALDDDGDKVPNHRDKCPGSEAGSLVDATGCYVMLKVDKQIRLMVNFANNSAEVTPEYYSEIGRVAEFMKQYPATRVVIEGHTDSRGAAAYNQQLSERRAAAVAKTLVNRFNVATERVASVGYGEAKPVGDNETADGRAANRRVVAVVSATAEKRATK